MKRVRYQNYDHVQTTKSFSDLWRWSRERRAKKKDLSVQIPQAPKKKLRNYSKIGQKCRLHGLAIQLFYSNEWA